MHGETVKFTNEVFFEGSSSLRMLQCAHVTNWQGRRWVEEGGDWRGRQWQQSQGGGKIGGKK